MKYQEKALIHKNAARASRAPDIFCRASSCYFHQFFFAWIFCKLRVTAVTATAGCCLDLPRLNVGFFDFIQTSNNELILSGTNGSIYIIKEGEKTLELNNKNGLTGGNVIKIFEDKEGTIWFLSPQKGVSQLLHKKMKLFDKYDLYFNGIDNIVKENDSSYYFVSRNNGIIKHCSSSGSFDTLKVPDSFESDPHIKYYSAILVQHEAY